jgi:hypothetical protein
MRKPQQYLSRAQVAERIRVQDGALSRYKLPPDAVIGPLGEDGSVPRGTFRGWLPTRSTSGTPTGPAAVHGPT